MEFRLSMEDLDVLVEFLQEAEEYLDGIEEKILQLETSQEAELANSIFRPVHTIKGTSSFLKLDALTMLSHELETLLDNVRKGSVGVTTELVDILLGGVDQISSIIKETLVSVGKKRVDGENVILELGEYDFEDLVYRIRGFGEGNSGFVEEKNGEERTSEDGTSFVSKTKIGSIPIDYKSITFPPGMKEGFEQEGIEQLDSVEDILLKLEKNPVTTEYLDDLFRSLHSLKGNAGVILSTIENEEIREHHFLNYFRDLSHGAESLIQKKRDESTALSAREIEILLSVTDGLKILLRDFQKNQERSFDPRDLIGQLNSAIVYEDSSCAEMGGTCEASEVSSLAFKNILDQCVEAIGEGLEEIANDDNRNKALRKLVRSFKTLCKLGKKVKHEVMEKEATDALSVLDFMKMGKDENEDLFLEDLQKKLDILKNEGDRRQVKSGETRVFQSLSKPGLKSPEKRVESSITSQVIRVPQERLDKIMNLVGELIVSKNNFAHLAREISLEYELPELGKKVKVAGDVISRIADELQATIMKTRMLPVSNVFSRFPRMIRDLSRNLHKKVKLEISGEETELDKTVIEAIGDPLVHLIRNSVDHGIESPEERACKGKPEEGTIKLLAYNRGQNVFIEISDDGEGIDPNKIRAKAIERGLINLQDLERLDDQSVCNLIFLPGFSTANEVTEVSGRGVGMDVVRTNIERIGGAVILNSVPEKGTTITIRLPLTLATSKGLKVETCSEHYFIPLDYVVETVKIEPEQIHRHREGEMAVVRGNLLPIYDMAEQLEIQRSNGSGNGNGGSSETELSLVILNINNRQLAVKVDRFYNESEFVIKSLGNGIAAVESFSGATVTGEGKVILVLDPSRLF